MNRNEYRRAFIMLRAVAPGYGGHVRLEQRTLTGSMYFIVTAPQDADLLRAALAGQRDGRYYAAPLGELTRDRRGQLSLAWQFDPRSVDGRPLEAYAWVVVSDAGGALRLIGNVEGSRAVSPDALGQAISELYAQADAPAADLPDPSEPRGPAATVSVPPRANAGIPEDGQGADAGRALPGGDGVDTMAAERIPEREIGVAEDDPGDIKIYTGSRTRIFTAMPEGDGRQSQTDAARQTALTPQADIPRQFNPASQADAASQADIMRRIDLTPRADAAPQADVMRPIDLSPQADALAGLRVDVCAEPVTAARQLGLDITRPWPASLEPLRRLFATQAPLRPAPDGEYTYIRAPVSEASGYPHCLIGLRAEEGRATGIRYALPGHYAPTPPAGLDNYRWLGDGEAGHWILDLPLEPGTAG